jgi:hypothetical protein
VKNIYQTDYTKVPKIFKLIKNHKNSEAIECLKKNPEEINLKGWMDDTPLHKAAECGNLELVKYLIKNEAEINAERSSPYATPLCWAKTLEIAILLLDNGATMNDRELDGATRGDRTEVIDELLSRGAKINHQEPQFLNCHSTQSLDVYLKHGIDISLTDKNDRSILHQKAWADNVEVFDHAFIHGAKWGKDSFNRTPYVLAQQGKSKKIIEHLTTHYPELTSHRITKVGNPESMPFEQICFFREHPNQKNVFYVLTRSPKIIKYEIQDDKLVAVKAISIDLPTVRNFTFSHKMELIVPTADNKLLKIDPDTLELLESIRVENYRFDQITFLVNKESYLASDGWKSYILDLDFNILRKAPMEDGVLYPLINKNEDLVATYSSDQLTYHNIYKFSEKNELKYIHTFFFEWNNCSEGFDFNLSGDKFGVSYPKSLTFNKLQNNEVKTIWSADISKFPSERDISDIVFIDDELLILGKGKKIILFSALSGESKGSLDLQLKAEIRGVKRNNNGDLLFVHTHLEIIPINIEKLKGHNDA